MIDPIEVTQQLRGEVFTYIDILMTNTIVTEEKTVENVIEEIVDLLFSFLDFSLNYLTYYKTNVELIKYLNKNQDIYLVDQTCAVLASLNEVLFTVKRIFAFDERVGMFYRVNLVN